MKKLLLCAALASVATLTAGAAGAVTWTTQLNYDSTGLTSSMGTVTITDGLNSGKDVQIAVNLLAGAFVDTGGHYVFAFNLDNSAGNVVTVNQPTGGPVDFVYENTWSQTVTSCTHGKHPVCTTTTQTAPPPYTDAPFGNFTNAFVLNPDGGNHTVTGPFVFTVHNDAGLSFAGAGPGPTIDPVTGKLLGLGGGLHFESNTTGSVPGAAGGWWFAVDTSGSDGHCSPTCVIAGRDAFTPVPHESHVAVPEPGAWALMILGFGGAGAMLRRRRAAAAIA
jgi:hypothetical protein